MSSTNPHFPNNSNIQLSHMAQPGGNVSYQSGTQIKTEINQNQFYQQSKGTSQAQYSDAVQQTLNYMKKEPNQNRKTQSPNGENKGPFAHVPERRGEVYSNVFKADNTQVSFAQMCRDGALGECLYCEKRFTDKAMGQIKIHLKQHHGIRPYTCPQCNFRHWDRTQMGSTHFVNLHGRKALKEEFIVDAELERQSEEKVNQEYQEIRANQVREYRKEPKTEKLVPPRDAGSIYNDYKYEEGYIGRKYGGCNTNILTKPETNDQKPATPPAKRIAMNLAASTNNASKAYSNNVPQISKPIVYEKADVPKELQELDLDKLLNNDF